MTVVVVPDTVKFPETIKLPAIVGLSTKPIWIWLLVTVVSISFVVPAKVNVSVPNVTVSLDPESAAIVKSVLIDAVLAAVICPYAFTVITGIAVDDPYDAAVTPVFVIAMSFAFAVIPVPPTTFNVTDPELPPPVKPSPAITSEISPATEIQAEPL